MTDKLTCYNEYCGSNFACLCSKEGVSETKYCRDWKGLDED